MRYLILALAASVLPGCCAFAIPVQICEPEAPVAGAAAPEVCGPVYVKPNCEEGWLAYGVKGLGVMLTPINDAACAATKASHAFFGVK